jgi:hypothetical protein
MTPTSLEQLEALLAAGTPGEWGLSGVEDDYFDGCVYARTERATDGVCQFNRSEDAALIVALRNAAPALIAELNLLRFVNRALNDTDRRLREQLEDMGRELHAARAVVEAVRNDIRIGDGCLGLRTGIALQDYDAAVAGEVKPCP